MCEFFQVLRNVKHVKNIDCILCTYWQVQFILISLTPYSPPYQVLLLNFKRIRKKNTIPDILETNGWNNLYKCVKYLEVSYEKRAELRPTRRF